MTADALAIVFSPNLLRAPQNDFSMILSNMGHTHKLVKSLITHVCPFSPYIDRMLTELLSYSFMSYSTIPIRKLTTSRTRTSSTTLFLKKTKKTRFYHPLGPFLSTKF
jgi:hypothetical protein